jgi:hypothetical protein
MQSRPGHFRWRMASTSLVIIRLSRLCEPALRYYAYARLRRVGMAGLVALGDGALRAQYRMAGYLPAEKGFANPPKAGVQCGSVSSSWSPSATSQRDQANTRPTQKRTPSLYQYLLLARLWALRVRNQRRPFPSLHFVGYRLPNPHCPPNPPKAGNAGSADIAGRQGYFVTKRTRRRRARHRYPPPSSGRL